MSAGAPPRARRLHSRDLSQILTPSAPPCAFSQIMGNADVRVAARARHAEMHCFVPTEIVMLINTFPAAHGCRSGRGVGAEHRRGASHKRRRGGPVLADNLLVVLRFACRGIEAVTVSSTARSISRPGSSSCPRSRRCAPLAALRAERRATPSGDLLASTAMAFASGRCVARSARTRPPFFSCSSCAVTAACPAGR